MIEKTYLDCPLRFVSFQLTWCWQRCLYRWCFLIKNLVKFVWICSSMFGRILQRLRESRAYILRYWFLYFRYASSICPLTKFKHIICNSFAGQLLWFLCLPELIVHENKEVLFCSAKQGRCGNLSWGTFRLQRRTRQFWFVTAVQLRFGAVKIWWTVFSREIFTTSLRSTIKW